MTDKKPEIPEYLRADIRDVDGVWFVKDYTLMWFFPTLDKEKIKATVKSEAVRKIETKLTYFRTVECALEDIEKLYRASANYLILEQWRKNRKYPYVYNKDWRRGWNMREDKWFLKEEALIRLFHIFKGKFRELLSKARTDRWGRYIDLDVRRVSYDSDKESYGLMEFKEFIEEIESEELRPEPESSSETSKELNELWNLLENT